MKMEKYFGKNVRKKKHSITEVVLMEKKQKKKVKLMIADNMFTFMSSEEEEYSRCLAAEVDRDIKEVCRCNRKSVSSAAILTALNYFDQLHKNAATAEALKNQLAGYLAEIIHQQADLEALEKENRRLREENTVYRARLKEEYPKVVSKTPTVLPVRPVHYLLSGMGVQKGKKSS